MNVLITGSSGFIGSHLVDKLLDDGHSVIGIDKVKSPKTIATKKFKFLQADIVCDNINIDSEIDYVVHLAAKDFYYDHPLDLKYSSFVETQVLGTSKTFELAKKLGAKKFIFASTHSVYGNTKKDLLTEKNIIPQPISPHGASKLAAEEVIRYMSNYYKLPAVILRISSVYGPRMTSHMLIPTIINSFKNQTQIKQYVDYEKSSRDFIYIDDVVSYITSALNKRIKFQIINIANGQSTKLSTVIEMIAKAMHKNPKDLKISDARKDYHAITVDQLTFDISRAKKILKYTPQTRLEDGLKKTIESFND